MGARRYSRGVIVTLACVVIFIRYILPWATLALMVYYTALAAFGHESWINKGGFRNGAGESCCGEGDCFVIPDPKHQVSARATGYYIWFDQVDPKDNKLTQRRYEIVPYAETQPSPDGAYWRCKRPDGSRRCFFAPPPNT